MPDDPAAKEGRTTAEVLRTSLRRLALATIFLYVILIAAGLKVYLDQRSTTKALCTLRADLSQRVADSLEFLRDHPDGIPGVPVKTLVDSITNQQQTIRSLSDLDCNEVKVVVPTPTPKPP